MTQTGTVTSFPSLPKVRSICPMYCIYAFWPALKLEVRQCMAGTLRVKAKQRLGPRVFLSPFIINNKNLTSLCGTTAVGKLAIRWHISGNTFLGSQVRVLILAFILKQQQPATSENYCSITSSNKGHIWLFNTYLVCYLSIPGINLVCLPIPWPERTRVIPQTCRFSIQSLRS